MATALEIFLRRQTESWVIAPQGNRLAERVQHKLAQLAPQTAVAPLPKILLIANDPVEFLSGFWAACIAQAPVFLANPNWETQEWQQVLSLAQPDLIWGTLPVDWRPMPNHSTTVTEKGWIMVPTGGSSGNIQFAIHTWDTLSASVIGVQKFFDCSPIHSFCVLPLYHVSGLMQFLRSCITGGQFIWSPLQTFIDPVHNHSQATPVTIGSDLLLEEFFLSLVPTQLRRLLFSREKIEWLRRFRVVFLGGAPAEPELLNQAKIAGISLAPTYGMTETASQIVTLKPEAFLSGQASVGQVLPHAQVKILSSAGEVLPVGETGHISIQSSALFLGYYPQQLPAGCNFASDDLGYMDQTGQLFVVGRSSQKIITGGENVFPSEVAAMIQATGLVKDVCVIGLPDQEWGQVVTAVYVANPTLVGLEQLQHALQGQLSRIKHPKQWIAVEALPRNPQGKINQQKLLELLRYLVPSLPAAENSDSTG